MTYDNGWFKINTSGTACSPEEALETALGCEIDQVENDAIDRLIEPHLWQLRGRTAEER